MGKMRDEKAVNVNLDYRFKILVFTALLTPLLLQLTGSWIFKISDDIIFVLVLLDALVAVIKKKIKLTYDITSMLMISLLIMPLLAGVFYAIIYDNQPMVVLLQLRQYKYLFMFLILMYYSREDIFDILFNNARLIAYISVPVAIVQRYLISADTGDVVTGLFGHGASGTMTLFLLVLFFAEFSYRLSRGWTLLGWYWLFWLPIGLNETKIAFFIAPVLFVLALIVTRKISLKNVTALLLCAVVFLYATGTLYNTVYETNIMTYFSKDKLIAYMYDIGEGDMGRIQKVNISLDIIGRTPLNAIIGYGLGSGFSGEYSQTTGIIAEKYDADNLFAGTRPQVFNSLIDTGYLGVAVQFLFVIVLLLKLLFSQGTYRLLHYTAIFSLAILFVGILYAEILTISNLAFLIFTSIYLACINRPGVSLPQNSEKEVI